MSIIVILVGLAAIAAVAAGTAYALSLAKRGEARRAEANQLDPGVDSGAPAEWAGAHTPEAKLHRRLVDVMSTLRVISSSTEEGIDGLELRVELEQHIRSTDQRLIQAATLPAGRREQALAEIEVSVAAIENAAADLAVGQSQVGTSEDVMGLEDLRGRIQGMTGEA